MRDEDALCNQAAANAKANGTAFMTEWAKLKLAQFLRFAEEAKKCRTSSCA